jgi:hypothetical protein
MGNLRSPEKKQKRYSRRDANNLFLQYSFHDRLLAETVHTVETEKIVSDVLARVAPTVFWVRSLLRCSLGSFSG